MNAPDAAAGSENERAKLQLELKKYEQEQAKLGQTQGNAAQDGMDALTQGMQTIQTIKNHPGLKDGFWDFQPTPEHSPGLWQSFVPGTDRKDLESMVDTLKSQQFLSGVKQLTGMGSLSNAEGEKIGAAIASLDTNQSSKSFKNAIGVIESQSSQSAGQDRRTRATASHWRRIRGNRSGCRRD